MRLYLARGSVRRVESILKALQGGKVSSASISDLNRQAYVPQCGLEKPSAAAWKGSICVRGRRLSVPELERSVRKWGHTGGDHAQRGRLSGGFGRSGGHEGGRGKTKERASASRSLSLFCLFNPVLPADRHRTAAFPPWCRSCTGTSGWPSRRRGRPGCARTSSGFCRTWRGWRRRP